MFLARVCVLEKSVDQKFIEDLFCSVIIHGVLQAFVFCFCWHGRCKQKSLGVKVVKHEKILAIAVCKRVLVSKASNMTIRIRMTSLK